MKFFVYILKSEKDQSLYIGQTSNIKDRLKRHNKGYSRSTKMKRPWTCIYFEEFRSRSEAMKFEKKLKSWKKRDAILNYIQQNRDVAQSG